MFCRLKYGSLPGNTEVSREIWESPRKYRSLPGNMGDLTGMVVLAVYPSCYSDE